MSNETRLPTEIVMKLAEELVPYDKNPRTHTDEQVEQIMASIREFGFTNPVLVDGAGGIIAGHGRLQAALRLGMLQVPTIELGYLTENQRKAYVIADNKLAINAGWDLEALAREMQLLTADDYDVGVMGFSAEELDELMKAVDVPYETDADPDAIPDVQAVPITKPGDVWVCGTHRVMCGDSTDRGTVELLLDGKRADLVFTDPPYGVALVKGGMVGADFGVAKKGKYDDVIGDNTTDTAKAFYELCKAMDMSRMIIFGGNYFTDFLDFSDGWLVWDKRGDSGIRNTFADGELAWCSFHTPVRLYTQLWNGMIRQGEHDKRLHPTQKPVNTVAGMIEDFSDAGQVVYDGFLGSGTTLIACQLKGRQCYGLEVSPAYVDVIVSRWQTYTGQEAVLADSGLTFAQVALSVDGLSDYEVVR